MKDEDIKFIATLMSAARKCGIGIRIDDTGGYIWIDRAVGKIIHGRSNDLTRSGTLMSACQALQEYFHVPQQQKDGA
jgi:hypothetical protein